MIAFQIRLNGRALGTAGIDTPGVLTTIATWMKRARHAKDGHAGEARFVEELTLDVGGLTHDRTGANVHVSWIRRRLEVGDEIQLKVVEVRRTTRPRWRRRDDPKIERAARRRY